MSKLQLLYKKQLSLINHKLIYDRKKYLEMKRQEDLKNASSKEENLNEMNGTNVRRRHHHYSDFMKAVKNYNSLNRKVKKTRIL
jgi:hypothetical protein